MIPVNILQISFHGDVRADLADGEISERSMR